MPQTGRNYIAGETSAAGEHTYFSVDPRSKTAGDLPYFNATREEVDRAVQAAVAAFAETRNYSSQEDRQFSR